MSAAAWYSPEEKSRSPFVSLFSAMRYAVFPFFSWSPPPTFRFAAAILALADSAPARRSERWSISVLIFLYPSLARVNEARALMRLARSPAARRASAFSAWSEVSAYREGISRFPSILSTADFSFNISSRASLAIPVSSSTFARDAISFLGASSEADRNKLFASPRSRVASPNARDRALFSPSFNLCWAESKRLGAHCSAPAAAARDFSDCASCCSDPMIADESATGVWGETSGCDLW